MFKLFIKFTVILLVVTVVESCEEYQELTPFLGFVHVWLIQDHTRKNRLTKKLGSKLSPNFQGL